MTAFTIFTDVIEYLAIAGVAGAGLFFFGGLAVRIIQDSSQNRHKHA